jgi:D-glycero-D-manno-heptose 1,7-bisphosphate phosphatase
VVSVGERRAVFLDRDGVINRALVRDGKPYAPTTIEQFEILPGVGEALARLRTAGFLNVVVTNQPDVGSGKTTRELVETMHAALLKNLPIDAVKVCYHVDADRCACRKPEPGMLLEAARELHVNLQASFVVGDRWRDIAAGQAAGCRCLFVRYQYSEKDPEKPYVAVNSLTEAAAFIVLSDSSHS